jgi:hypothetical protein
MPAFFIVFKVKRGISLRCNSTLATLDKNCTLL